MDCLDVVVDPTSTQEQDIVTNMTTDSGQQRTTMNKNDILMRVAQRRANDMIARSYFSHVDPDGYGANHHLREAGFDLHSSYDTGDADNNVESIGTGTNSSATMWSTWMNSPGHKQHILGETQFFEDQTEYGVGYATNGAGSWRWVVLWARHN
jgi:uncharacterized protein YkwD